MWRFQDAIKNSKSMFAQAYCSHTSLLNKTGNQQIAFCLVETGNDWYEVEDRFKFGIFSKKEQYLKNVVVEGENQLVQRSRVKSFCLNSFNYNDEKISFVVNKYA